MLNPPSQTSTNKRSGSEAPTTTPAAAPPVKQARKERGEPSITNDHGYVLWAHAKDESVFVADKGTK